MKLTLKKDTIFPHDFLLLEKHFIFGKRNYLSLCESGVRGFWGKYPNLLHIYAKNPKKKNTIKCRLNPDHLSVHVHGQGNWDVYYCVIAFLKDHNVPKEFYVVWE